jgi:aerotolerance regulator-like protein/VWA domain-containing protein
MTLANPAALWGLLLIPLILLLYVLRTERRRLPWSNVRLWRGLGEELEARRNWRPPRRSLLLALQLAFVAVAVLALAGPTLLRPAEGEHLIVVLDASASLGATDVLPTRFAAAQALALERLARLGPGDHATVIRAGAEARPLVEAVAAPLARAAVEGAALSQAPGDLRSALLLAGAAAATSAGNPRVVVFTDGSFAAAAGGRPGWPAVAGELAAPVEYVAVGRGDANVAVTALALRRPPNGGPTAGYARVTNLGSAPAAVPARLLADNLPLQSRRLDLAPAASEELTFALPPGTRTVAVQLDAPDLLAADNRAEARAPASGDRAVTLVSAQPDLLARALRALPGVRVTTVAPDDYAGAALAPLVVFDAFLPRVLPAADAIVVNPPAGGALEVLGEVPAPATLSYDRGHPLLDAIDPAALQISKIRQLRAPAWTNAVLWSADGPALLEGTNGGRRVVILAFDPRASNLPRLRAFPLLLANALDRLGWGEREGTVATGQAVRLPPNAGGQVVDGPAGTETVPAGALAFADTERVGRYAVHTADRATDLAEFRASLLGPGASDVRPNALAPLAAAASADRPPAPALAFVGLLLLAALGISTGEWWWWSKGN